MREHYDFGRMKGERNPYAKQLKQPVMMYLDKPTITYFASLAEEFGMPYENLINLYLRDCAIRHKKLNFNVPNPENPEPKRSMRDII
uniref:BrnA antitoxin of type II toxin-antitoxin system n=1 Tax=Candidatus Kentrum sp. DK TaxID=2126562 RepID=A0A450T070_9GAMM|nr:MAG: hypothetical protein BECKDK2373B_GA0170837_108713 [Candidatus Kentron sp. DK]